jgi:hypothetical protein
MAWDPTILLVGRLIISFVLAAAGFGCVYLGYRLFMNGAGLAKGVNTVSVKNEKFIVSASGMSAGSVLMLTSAAWAFGAWTSVPKVVASNGSISITQAPTPVDYKKFLGTDVVTASKEPVGEIKAFILGKDAQSSGYVVNLGGSKANTVVVDPKYFELERGKDTRAVIRLNKEQLNQFPNFQAYQGDVLPRTDVKPTN